MFQLTSQRATIRPNKIIQYEVWEGDRKQQANLPRTNAQKSTISSKASLRLESSIYLLTQLATKKQVYDDQSKKYFTFKLNFITLTLPSAQVHSDIDIYNRIFKPFIRWCRDRFTTFLYIWKAEKQDNGNLHYHLTTNTFIHWRTLRNKWNRCCDALGYIQRCKVVDPNSTDIHSIRNIRNLPKYLASYMTKKDLYKKVLKRYHRRFDKTLKAMDSTSFVLPKNYLKNIKDKVTCKHWDCSKILLENKCITIIEDWEHQKELNDMDYNQVESVVTDHCRIWNIKPNEWRHLPVFRLDYESYLSRLRSSLLLKI